jgi:polysaccharide deacetylase family protein (PEP-CTERM system associated)
MTTVRNALSIDVEDYFHVSAFRDQIRPGDWSTFESRVERNTDKTLAVLAASATKATFFVLGWVAERYPSVVRSIAAAGHEVACHGYSHQLIYQQQRAQFVDETVRAKALLEDQCGHAVIGYRAASFSITDSSRWALDVLAQCGFRYDSSLFPIRHDLYGSAVESDHPHALTTPSGAMLIEFPMTVAKVLGVRVPVSGGGYFRLYPYWLTRALLRARNHAGTPFVFYLHPWELDPEQPRIAAPWRSRFRHYNNLASCEAKLMRLIGDFEFTTMQQVLTDTDLLSQVPAPALP